MTQTSTGIKLSISSGIPATYDLSGYGALTYFEIGEVTNIPQFGAQFQTVTNQPLATGITEKRKGFVNYGDPVIDMALDNSNMGQQMMKSACDGIRKSQVHAFMLQYGNGEIRYWSGRVFSFQEAPGSANNMVGATSQIGITRAILQIPRITLDLSFAENFYSLGGEPKNFSDIITFSRSTTATYFNASGVLTTAAIDEPCLAYDPSTLEPLGLQVFGAATNLLTYSEQFDNADWVKSGATVTPNTATAPDGALTMDKIVEDSAIASHGARQSLLASAGLPYTVSFYLRAGERNFSAEFEYGLFGVNTCVFDLSSGTTAFTGGGSATITDLGGGLFFCTRTLTATGSGGGNLYTSLINSAGEPIYQGDGTSGIYIWGAQLETGSIATPYIKTEASQVTRAADIATVDDLSGWYNQSQGSVFVDFDYAGEWKSGIRSLFSYEADLSNRFSVFNNPGASGSALFVSDAGSSSVAATAGDAKKISVSYSQSGSRIVDNTGVGFTPSFVSAFLSGLYIGNVSAGVEPLNGYIKTLNHYPSELTENEMKLITL